MLPRILEEELFVGREAEVKELTDWIGNSNASIISIVGSPGIGKSTLAIRVGHEITKKGGIAVFYADLCEVQDINTLNEKLKFLVLGEKRRSSEYLFTWASELKVQTLFILDNSDWLLNKNKDEFQNLIKNFVRQSRLVTVMLTVQQLTSFLVPFRKFTVQELSTESAANVLQKLSNKINGTMALEIASLVGNVPLALQVVGSLLKHVDPSTIANDLRRDPIPALSPELLPSTERMFTRLNISYHYLTPEHQKCGRLLALFPGSFDEPAVRGILEGKLVQDSSKCLEELYYKSLLLYNTDTRRYRFQQLVKKFFTHISSEFEERNAFFNHFRDYYSSLLALKARSDSMHELFTFLDLERLNIDPIYDHILETFTPTDLEAITSTMSTKIDAVLNVLRGCKTLHFYYNSARNILLRAILKNHWTAKVVRIMKLRRVSGSHHATVIANKFIKLLQEWRSYILRGDVHRALKVGITIGREGLVSFDAEFKFVSAQKGLHMCLMTYVKLLVHLSKLEAIVHGKLRAMQMLQSRHSRITELHSYPTANSTEDAESHQIYVKYHSALACHYVHFGQFDPFIESWKAFLQLKWPLAQCKQVGCTSAKFALAQFGQGDYEQSAEQMETLLHSTSLRGNQRVQLFILLYESYMRLGEVEKASHLLTKDHLLSKFQSIKTINATDHRFRNSTSLSILYNENQTDHSGVWLLDQECTTISSKNYKTCKILAAFYNSLGSKEATTLGRVLNHAQRHQVRILKVDIDRRWWDYEIYLKEVCDSRNTFVILMTVLAIIVILAMTSLVSW